VSPERYELGFYIPEDGILHSHRRHESLKAYFVFPSCLEFQTMEKSINPVILKTRIFSAFQNILVEDVNVDQFRTSLLTALAWNLVNILSEYFLGRCRQKYTY
jgi:hypothetical protein